jgi:hypothetical protein
MRTVLCRAGLVLAASGALVLSPACTDSSPTENGDQQQEQQDDQDRDNGDDQEDGDDG